MHAQRILALTMLLSAECLFAAAPAPATAPAITSALLPGVVTISGTAQATGAAYSSVNVFVCVSKTKPAAGALPDCSSGSSQVRLAPGTSAAPGTSYVTVGADGKVTATLASGLAAGDYVWFTEVATPAGGTAASVESASAVPVGAAPTIKSSTSGSVSTVSGQGQASNADFAAPVQIFVCTSSKAPIGTPDCSASSATLSNASIAGKQAVATDPNGNFSATLATPVASGTYVWVTQVATPAGAAAAQAQTTETVPVQISAAAGGTTGPLMTTKVISGISTVTLLNGDEGSIQLFEFDPGILPAKNQCQDSDRPNSNLLTLVISTPATAGGSSTTTNATSAVISGTGPYTITLAQPLVAGSTLCIKDTPKSSPNAEWSAPIAVTDPNDYGRMRAYFIAGVQVSNQQSGTSSSTAGQYVEAGLKYTWLRAKDSSDLRYDKNGLMVDKDKNPIRGKRSPGISADWNFRLSPIPVAAPATTTTTTSTTNPPTISTTPNFLSSQQSARVVGNIYFPWKATHWNKHSDYLTIAPLARGGFATLLNPSLSSNSSTTSTSANTTPNSVIVGQFNSAYSFVGYGARFGWDRFPTSTDEGPQTITEFLMTLGNYSNLPSYICKAAPAGVTVTPNSNSACGMAGTPLKNDPVQSRMLIPRLDIEMFAKLPNYPFVFGLDANLAQYTVYRNRGLRQVDYLNKAGNDIRIYVGVNVDLNSFLKKAGISLP